VADELPTGRLVLAGAGGDYRSVEDQVRDIVAADPVLRGSVELPGWVADLHSLLSRCDVYAFPSRSEGMSNSLVEACAAGRVVVASAIPANVEVLGDDYPLLFPPGDVDRLTQCLRMALMEPATRSAAAAGTAARARRLLLSEVGRRLGEVLLGAADHAHRELPGRLRRR
jgi:glycosyltransferase involved in cell wall biosynthesis